MAAILPTRASRRAVLSGLVRVVAGGGLATLAGPATLAGCGPAGAVREAPAGAAKPPAQVHVVGRGDEATLRLIRQQALAFAEEVPEVQVEIDHPADWLGAFRALVASGGPVDVVYHSHTDVGGSVRAGLLENLEPYLARQRDFREGDFERGAWLAAQYEGKRWGLPYDSGAYALVFNIALLEAANVPLPDPKTRMTWDDLLGIARRLTADEAGKRPTDRGFDPGAAKVYGFATNATWGLATFIMSGGGELLTADGKVPVDGPDAVEALQFFADLQTKHDVAPPAGRPPAQPVAFELGNLAMAYQGVWQLGQYNAAGIRWGAVPAPMRKAAVSGGHFSPLAMAHAARQKDAAWSWLTFACLSERGQGLLVDAGQMQPTRKSLESRFVDAVAPPAAPYRQAFADELKGGTLRVAGDRAGSYWGGYKREWAQLWNTELAPVFRGEQAALQVAPTLRRRTELLLKLGWAPVVTA